jgi:hypothetical protein
MNNKKTILSGAKIRNRSITPYRKAAKKRKSRPRKLLNFDSPKNRFFLLINKVAFAGCICEIKNN